jgi:hypothetical protein
MPVRIAANYLGEHPAIIKDIQSGSFDMGLLIKGAKDYLQANGVNKNTAGSSPQITKYLKQAILAFDDFGGQKAADNIGTVSVHKGIPQKTLNVPPPAALAQDVQEIVDMITSHKGPDQVYEEFKEDIHLMLNGATFSGVIAYGRGGTGKTYNAEDAAREEGLSEGTGYALVGGSMGGQEALMSKLYINRETPLVLFDDADSVFGSAAMQDIMKHALDNSNPYVQINSSGKDIKDEEGNAIPKGKYPIDSKFVFCTNKQEDTINGPILTRCVKHNFNFTDDEVADAIRKRFQNICYEMNADDLDLSDCDFIIGIIRKGIEGHAVKELNFRLVKDCTFRYWLGKNKKLDLTKCVVRALQGA